MMGGGRDSLASRSGMEWEGGACLPSLPVQVPSLLIGGGVLRRDWSPDLSNGEGDLCNLCREAE